MKEYLNRVCALVHHISWHTLKLNKGLCVNILLLFYEIDKKVFYLDNWGKLSVILINSSRKLKMKQALPFY